MTASFKETSARSRRAGLSALRVHWFLAPPCLVFRPVADTSAVWACERDYFRGPNHVLCVCLSETELCS